METKKIGKLNMLGSGLAFLITVYIGIIYILLMAGSSEGNIGFEMTTGYAGYWAFRFVVCILVYLCALVNIVAIPAYFALKAKGSDHPALKGFGATQIIASIVMLIAVIMFCSAQGPIFDADVSTPFATPYRIVELILAILSVGGVILTTVYTANSDVIHSLKKKYNKK